MLDISRREMLAGVTKAGAYFSGPRNLGLATAGGEANSAYLPPRAAFSRLLDSWWYYYDPGYLDFVDELQPQAVQVGFYGVDFWALAHVPKAVKGKTASVHAVDGDLKASGQFLENLNKELHERGIKVIGHFDVEYHVTGLIDGPEGPREGFFKFYNELWEENGLGPKPVENPLELLERKADGTPHALTDLPGYSPWPLYHGCLNNPRWRQVLKAFLKRGIERGLDGFVANYFYTDGCVCKYCVGGFKDFLRQRYSPPELLRQFGIQDLEKHRITEIIDWYSPGEMTPLRLEGLRFSDISRKQAYDDVFIHYGRSLKPDLLVAQWVHSHVPEPSDSERFMLPPVLWGKGEDYFWYSLGTPTSNILQVRYVRGAGGGRLYSGHYGDATNPSCLAEFCANGGSPSIRRCDFSIPKVRNEMVRFFQFMKAHEDVYQHAEMAGECVLLYPRSEFQQGRYADAVGAFEGVGARLLGDRILFDVLPDDMATPEKLARYKKVFTTSSMSEMKGMTYQGLSRFHAPSTVRVSASRPSKGRVWDIHIVNYHPKELELGGTTLLENEDRPAATGVNADLVIPKGLSIGKVEWISLESPEPKDLPIEKNSSRARFTVPDFMLYAIARVYFSS